MSHTLIIVGKCVTNARKWIWGGHLPVGKSNMNILTFVVPKSLYSLKKRHL